MYSLSRGEGARFATCTHNRVTPELGEQSRAANEIARDLTRTATRRNQFPIRFVLITKIVVIFRNIGRDINIYCIIATVYD